ncbi:MAG: cellulose biosynthesis protein BcsE [Candidimonas sp.]|nr:MAG: cellulose biosynthesis protein BcsE [Candidimonas sp.]TAM18654.1 MAG: cellulose biosynthesis protein BcsE [Candidimonas sp.]TAM74263.1 MAG: cellulose biosynthesis protein BcsE [Candidimonas sp.]
MVASFSVVSTLFGRVGTLRRNAAARGRRRGSSRLAIESLPDAYTALDSAGLYAVYVGASPARDTLLFDTAKSSRAKKVTLVLNRDPSAVVEILRERGFSSRGAAAWPRKLNVLASQSSAEDLSMEQSAAFPPLGRLIGALRAIKRYGLKSGSLYLVEGANSWLSWHSSAALAQEAEYLAQWCMARRCLMVLFLSRYRQGEDPLGQSIEGQDPFSRDSTGGVDLQGFHNAFTGVAYLSQSLGEMVWMAKFWRVDDTMVTAQSQALRYTPEGALAIALSTREVGASMLLTRDESRVLATRAAVAGESWVPSGWEIVSDYDAMTAACQQVRGVTVLLDYSVAGGLDGLCRTIHGLRSHCGRAIKIVVRERELSMRHQNELLVLSLGANMVALRNLSLAQLQILIESVQGQLSTRSIINDYHTALSAAQGEPVCGYLTIVAFCDQVERVIERGHILHLPHVLLRLKLYPEVSHLEVLRACALLRSGDICSADTDFLYLFLFGCPISDTDIVLEKIFNSKLSCYFESIERYEVFKDKVAQIRAKNSRHPAPDYTDLLAPPGRPS